MIRVYQSTFSLKCKEEFSDILKLLRVGLCIVVLSHQEGMTVLTTMTRGNRHLNAEKS